ncbi:hypothetical protein CK203_080745 [Vitis vinifera]|nr:hypothetical protein CK203_080745 [Vitis vinifera]
MYRDVSSCNSYNYGDALYWDARYIQEAGSFDWYQRYSALRPFVRRYIPTSSRVLMVGCGNAVLGFRVFVGVRFVAFFGSWQSAGRGQKLEFSAFVWELGK